MLIWCFRWHCWPQKVKGISNQISPKSPFPKLKEIKHVKSMLITLIFHTWNQSGCPSLNLLQYLYIFLILRYQSCTQYSKWSLTSVLYKVRITSLYLYSIFFATYPGIFFTANTLWHPNSWNLIVKCNRLLYILSIPLKCTPAQGPLMRGSFLLQPTNRRRQRVQAAPRGYAGVWSESEQCGTLGGANLLACLAARLFYMLTASHIENCDAGRKTPPHTRPW